MKRLLLATTCFLAGTIPVGAVTIKGGVGGWRQRPSGWVEYKKDGIVSEKTHVDVKDDMHLSDKTKGYGWFEIDDIPVLPNIRVSYTPMKFNGSGKVKTNYSFGSIKVNANDKIDAKLRANQVDLTLAYGLPFIQTVTNRKLDIDAGVNVKVIDGYLKVRDETRNEEDSKSKTIPVPMAYLSGSFKPLGLLSLSASGSWIGYSGNQFYDISGEAKVYPLKGNFSSLFIGAGYRYQRLKIDDISGVSSNVKVKGPFAEVGFRF